ncbi:exported hypothetical protein [Gammaproteobacteria bacterium]
MKKLYFILILSVLLSSCANMDKCTRLVNKVQRRGCITINTTIKDSIIIKDSLIERFISIPNPADSSLITALIKCDSLGNAYISQILNYQTGNHITASISTNNNKTISFKCNVDSFAVYTKVKDRYLSSNRLRTEIKTIQLAPEKYIPAFFKWCTWILWILVIGFIIWKIIKIYLKGQIGWL